MARELVVSTFAVGALLALAGTAHAQANDQGFDFSPFPTADGGSGPPAAPAEPLPDAGAAPLPTEPVADAGETMPPFAVADGGFPQTADGGALPPGTQVIHAFVEPSAESEAEAKAGPKERDFTMIGGGLDVGFPDGAGLSVVVRPIKMLRVHGGVTTAVFATGLRLGVSFVPFYFPITPTLTVEGGTYFPGNFSGPLSAVVKNVKFLDGAKQVSYQYVNGHLGLEVGSPKRFVVFLRGGLSYTEFRVNRFQDTLRVAANDPDLEAQDPALRVAGPSGKLGILFYVW